MSGFRASRKGRSAGAVKGWLMAKRGWQGAVVRRQLTVVWLSQDGTGGHFRSQAAAAGLSQDGNLLAGPQGAVTGSNCAAARRNELRTNG